LHWIWNVDNQLKEPMIKLIGWKRTIHEITRIAWTKCVQLRVISWIALPDQ
jgi:hypothetical protein